jgi:hypothetical protein
MAAGCSSRGERDEPPVVVRDPMLRILVVEAWWTWATLSLPADPDHNVGSTGDGV